MIKSIRNIVLLVLATLCTVFVLERVIGSRETCKPSSQAVELKFKTLSQGMTNVVCADLLADCIQDTDAEMSVTKKYLQLLSVFAVMGYSILAALSALEKASAACHEQTHVQGRLMPFYILFQSYRIPSGI